MRALAVFTGLRAVGSFPVEHGYVGAGNEVLAISTEHDAADVIVRRCLVHTGFQFLPHLGCHGIQALWVGEDDRSDGAILLQGYSVTHMSSRLGEIASN